MSERIDTLESLHTALIDSRNGYDEAVADADGKGLTPLFKEMIAIHSKDAEDIAAALAALGVEVGDSGSLMSTVNRTVISVRSLVSELDERILPALIDGEQRVLSIYDDALKASQPSNAEFDMLSLQREALRQKIADMQRQNDIAA